MDPSLEDLFAQADNLLKVVPLSLLKCPKCENTGAENFTLVYTMRYYCPVCWDGPSKVIMPDYNMEDFSEMVGDQTLCCEDCGHGFPIPDDWNLATERYKDVPKVPDPAVEKAAKQKKQAVEKYQFNKKMSEIFNETIADYDAPKKKGLK